MTIYKPDQEGAFAPEAASEAPPDLVDPEERYVDLKSKALDMTRDMMPQMYEKFLNAPAKESLMIFESISNRAGFVSQEEKVSPQGVQILNISGPDVAGMLNGLKTIVQGDN